MSAKVSGLVLERFPAESVTDFGIALVLADAADQDGSNVFPSVARVAALSRTSERTVQRAITRFREMGFLTLVCAGGGAKRPNKFRVELNWLSSQPSVLGGRGGNVTPLINANPNPDKTLTKPRQPDKGKVTKPRPGCDTQPDTQPLTQKPFDPPPKSQAPSDGLQNEDEIRERVEAAIWASNPPPRNPVTFAVAVERRLLQRGPNRADDADLKGFRAHKMRGDWGGANKRLDELAGVKFVDDENNIFMVEKLGGKYFLWGNGGVTPFLTGEISRFLGAIAEGRLKKQE